MSTEPSAPLDLAALEADIARHRTSLAASVDELTSRLNPRELARSAAGDARRSLLGTPGPDGVVTLAKYNVKATGHVASLRKQLGI